MRFRDAACLKNFILRHEDEEEEDAICKAQSSHLI